MRIIKFRAWDSETEQFVYSDQVFDLFFFEFIDGNLKAMAIRERRVGPPEDWMYTEEIEEPQIYTGLKDKNSKEIYEGDLISIGDNSNIYEIVFETGDFQVGFKKKGGNNFTDIGKEFCTKFEVIGNIYENQELL